MEKTEGMPELSLRSFVMLEAAEEISCKEGDEETGSKVGITRTNHSGAIPLGTGTEGRDVGFFGWIISFKYVGVLIPMNPFLLQTLYFTHQ